MMNNNSEIELFWRWFSGNQADFGHKFENKELLSELDKQLANLGVHSWEVGPGLYCEKQLVVSPGGELTLLELTNKIVSLAPTINDWEFYPAKQPKEWSLQVNLWTQTGTEVKIDGSIWKFVILKYEDGATEIIMQASNVINLNIEDKITAGEILLDGLLGEENRIRWFQYIDVIDQFDKEYSSQAQNIKELLRLIR